MMQQVKQTPDDAPAASTIDALAERYGISRATVYRQINSKRLRTRKLGRRTLILASDEQEWIASLPAV